jgi:hypothetical protein
MSFDALFSGRDCYTNMATSASALRLNITGNISAVINSPPAGTTTRHREPSVDGESNTIRIGEPVAVAKADGIVLEAIRPRRFSAIKAASATRISTILRYSRREVNRLGIRGKLKGSA